MSEHTFLFELGVEELPPGYINQFKVINTDADYFEKTKEFEEKVKKGLPAVLKEDYSFFACISRLIIDNKIPCKNADLFCTPRRLAVLLHLDSDKQNFEATEEKRTGPKVQSLDDKPAVGFAKGCGVEPKDLQQGEDGRVFCMVRVEPKPVKDLLPDIVQKAFEQFNKTVGMRFMHWGDKSDLFIRPVKWLTCLYDKEVVEMEWFGLTASNSTRGHRFHSAETVTIKHAKDYESTLEKHFVMANFGKRRETIRQSLENIALENDATIPLDEDLLDEVTAINEWPHAVLCNIDPSFLTVPQEGLIKSMKSHQKSFPVLDKVGKMLPFFVTVSNIEVKDYSSIKHGNEKVMAARLSDAKFFYETDLKKSLAEMNEKCKSVTFQNKLGTQWDKTKRVILLAEFIAEKIGADVDKVKRAAELANADLNSQMVFEFPELQGIMGKYYAGHQGEDSVVADAIEQRYWPRFSDDNLPETKEAQSLALADRFDTLIGIFGIGQKPSGSKDPFSLRRAAIGVVRIIRENRLAVSLKEILEFSKTSYPDGIVEAGAPEEVKAFINKRLEDLYNNEHPDEPKTLNILRAILAAGDDKLHDVDERFEALKVFKDREEMKTLAEMNKRCKNILRKALDAGEKLAELEPKLFDSEFEQTLADSGDTVSKSLNSGKNYEEQLEELTHLAKPLADFFDNVMVMCDDPKVKNNRLALLNKISVLFQEVADVSYL